MNRYLEVLSKTRLASILLSPKPPNLDASRANLSNQSVNTQKNMSKNSSVNSQLTRDKSCDLITNVSTQSINILNNLIENFNSKKQTSNLVDSMSLLDWIKSTDAKNRLEIVVDETKDILENFEKNQRWNELNNEINEMMVQVEDNTQFREIEGLTKRLEDLKNLLDESNRILIGQNEITEVISFY